MAPLTRRAARNEVPDDFDEELETGSWDMSASHDSYAEDSALDPDDRQASRAFDGASRESSQLESGYMDDMLTPLKDTADRVGREVENFARKLDQLSSLTKRSKISEEEAALGLTTYFRTVSQDEVSRLRPQRIEKLEEQIQQQWIDKVKGTKVQAQDSNTHRQNTSLAQDRTRSATQDYDEWNEEQYTWDLLKIVLSARERQASRMKNPADTPSNHANQLHRYSTDESIWKAYIHDNPEDEEQSGVLGWLRRKGERSGSDVEIMREASRDSTLSDIAFHSSGWIETALAIKAEKRLRSWPKVIEPSASNSVASLKTKDKTKTLVTQLDPDAPERQMRALEKADKVLETSMWLTCWEMCRRGDSWIKIREYCAEIGEQWRAFTLLNQSHFHSRTASEGPLLDERSTSQHLWRHTCLDAVRSMGPDANIYERALLGAASGDLRAIEPVCQSWDDHLFANFTTELTNRFTAYARSHPRLNLAHTKKPKEISKGLGSRPRTRRDVLKSLQHNLLSTRTDVRTLKYLQNSFIGGDFLAFFRHYGREIAHHAQKGSRLLKRSNIETSDEEYAGSDSIYHPHDIRGLRTVAHAVIILEDDIRATAKADAIDDIENIVVAYMSYLRENKHIVMLPLYASKLSKTRGAEALGILLVDVKMPDEQKMQVKLMEKHGIDPSRVVHHLVQETVRRYGSSSSAKCIPSLNFVQKVDVENGTTGSESNDKHSRFQSDSGGLRIRTDLFKELKESDGALIRGFEWYLAIRTDSMNDWIETFAVGTRLYYQFLAQGNLIAAAELNRRMPADSIWIAKGEKILARPVHNSAIDNWQGGQLEQPMKLKILQKYNLLYTQFESVVVLLSQFHDWASSLEETSSVNISKSKEVKENLKNLRDTIEALVSPMFKNFLTEPAFDVTNEDLNSLRNVYLPEIILAFISVLNVSGHILTRSHLLRAMEVFSDIGGEESDLLECFTQAKRTCDLVNAAAATSREMLRANQAGRTKGKKWGGDGSNLEIWSVKP